MIKFRDQNNILPNIYIIKLCTYGLMAMFLGIIIITKKKKKACTYEHFLFYIAFFFFFFVFVFCVFFILFSFSMFFLWMPRWDVELHAHNQKLNNKIITNIK